MSIFEFFILAYGVYIIFAYSKMRVTRVIPPQLISKKINLDRARDLSGYIDAVVPKGIAFGALAVVCSIIMLLGDYGFIIDYVRWAAEIVFFIGLIVFAVLVTKDQKKFIY